MEDCFQSLVKNTSLHEIRLFGSPIPSYIISGLFYSLQYGLSNLVILDFDYYSTDKLLVQNLIKFCSERIEKKIGYNVTIRATEYDPNENIILSDSYNYSIEVK